MLPTVEQPLQFYEIKPFYLNQFYFPQPILERKSFFTLPNFIPHKRIIPMPGLSQNEQKEALAILVSMSGTMSDIDKSLSELNETMTNIDERLVNIDERLVNIESAAIHTSFDIAAMKPNP